MGRLQFGGARVSPDFGNAPDPHRFPCHLLGNGNQYVQSVSGGKVFTTSVCPHPSSEPRLGHQQWKALIDPMVITSGDPIQLDVYYRLYGFNAGLGRVPL